MRNLHFAIAAVCAIAIAGPAGAEYEHCKHYPAGSLNLDSYELVGAEACETACSETEGCNFWSYTPHNFNPKNGPGHCRGMDAVGETTEDSREFCGANE